VRVLRLRRKSVGVEGWKADDARGGLRLVVLVRLKGSIRGGEWKVVVGSMRMVMVVVVVVAWVGTRVAQRQVCR
jgi:hypothetical protein